MVQKTQTPTAALFDACARGNMAKVEQLLAKGANINCREFGRDCDQTPLMMAAGWGHGSLVKFLLGKGADPNAKATLKVHQRIAANKVIDTEVVLTASVIARHNMFDDIATIIEQKTASLTIMTRGNRI